jgi:hypothetical protein
MSAVTESVVEDAALGGHSQWSQLTEADTPAAARDLARICAHFLRAAPDLVAGLSPSAD